jgi:hypothetical protein
MIWVHAHATRETDQVGTSPHGSLKEAQPQRMNAANLRTLIFCLRLLTLTDFHTTAFLIFHP